MDPGNAGDRTKILIERRVVCVDCGDSATKPIDFDVFGFLEQLPVCCECFGAVHLKVEDNLRRTEHHSFTGINDWGRA